jgi:excinuclease ABC subunit C
LAPCVSKQSEEDYNISVAAIRQILKGDLAVLIKFHKREMAEFAVALDFEEAALLKKKLDLLKNFQAKSTIVNTNIKHVDVFGIVSDDKAGYVSYMKVNDGLIVHSHTMEVRKRLDESDAKLLAHAVVSIRESLQSDSTSLFLSEKLDVNLPDVNVLVPQRGDKKKLVDLSVRNARFFMRDRHKQEDLVNPSEGRERVLRTLKEDLKLQEMPVHIECFDNSNIQGTNPSSACVVFKDGKPSKEDYRKFNIKTVDGPDDFASMYEVVYRRYKRLAEEKLNLPQLIIIDGGKGQLSSSVAALKDLGLFGSIAIIGIAKKLEEIFFPGDSFPLYIDKRSESLKLIQHLRNEAHRFSLAHHRNRRSKAALKSELTDIKGIGPSTAEELLLKFKSVKRVGLARLEELEEVVNKRHARLVWQHFNEEKH